VKKRVNKDFFMVALECYHWPLANLMPRQFENRLFLEVEVSVHLRLSFSETKAISLQVNSRYGPSLAPSQIAHSAKAPLDQTRTWWTSGGMREAAMS
jgi:hypothetical protein